MYKSNCIKQKITHYDVFILPFIKKKYSVIILYEYLVRLFSFTII